MKKLVLAISMLAASSAGAFAADLAARPYTKAPPMLPVAPVFSWTGCYIGAHGGYGWGRDSNTFGDAVLADEGFDGTGAEFANQSHDISGGVAGGQIGCNYQIQNNWVVGLEGQAGWSGIKGSHIIAEDRTDPGVVSGFSTNNLWNADISARLGYAIDRTLIYGKAGAAWGGFRYGETQDDFSSCPRTSCTVNIDQTRFGYLLGAGVEYAFDPHWSVKLEYNYIDYGSASLGYLNQTLSVRDTINVVKVGVNYMFGAGGPLVARY